MACTITLSDFKTQFDRGPFTYSEVLPDVRDKDITEAIAEAEAVFNPDLYPDEGICKLAKLYLSAHFLVNDLESADGGGASKFNQSSRSVGSVSESLSIPEWMNDGDFALYTTTSFGIKFLTLSKPYLGGGVYSVPGGTSV